MTCARDGAGGSLLDKRLGMSAAFAAGALSMVLAVMTLVALVHEPAEFTVASGLPRAPRIGLVQRLRNAVETYFTLYATRDLGMEAAAAGGALTFYAGGAILFAIVAGIIGQHLGRRLTMSIGLVCAMAVFLPMPWVGRPGLVAPLALIFGVLWTLVFINALPWIAELGGVEHTGTMTAYYYLATSGGAAVSPALFGLIQQWTGEYRWMFIYACVFFVVALVCMPFIKHGEAPSPVR